MHIIPCEQLLLLFGGSHCWHAISLLNNIQFIGYNFMLYFFATTCFEAISCSKENENTYRAGKSRLDFDLQYF